mgnify:CR=1 FL=1
MVLLVKRNKESLYIFGMCISLVIMLSGILLYIAKKGGISNELQDFFFFNVEVKSRIQYFLITLDHLGYTIAIGRTLFPLFLLNLALHYSKIPWIQRSYWIKRITFVLPIASFVLYYPSVFRTITNNVSKIELVIMGGTFVWIVLYIIISIIFLLYEAYSFKMRLFQRKFILIISFIFSITALYILYFAQDPIQVYQFYSYKFIWTSGIYYMNSVLSIPAYISIILLNVILAIIGCASILQYTHEIFESSREEIKIQRKFDAISTGTSVFVHSIKNQLLANRVLFKRLNRSMEGPLDIEMLKESISKLSEHNDAILQRIEELYRSVKKNSVHLVPVSLGEVIDTSIERFHQKYPDQSIHVERNTSMVLADKMHLSEAIYNLLINAQEAVSECDEAGEVLLKCYNDKLHTVIEVKDNGIGISKTEMKKICEPFYSKKNSNYNWGMGLHYVRMIAKEHFGSLRFESKENEGSTFYLLLPKFKE